MWVNNFGALSSISLLDVIFNDSSLYFCVTVVRRSDLLTDVLCQGIWATVGFVFYQLMNFILCDWMDKQYWYTVWLKSLSCHDEGFDLCSNVWPMVIYSRLLCSIHCRKSFDFWPRTFSCVMLFNLIEWQFCLVYSGQPEHKIWLWFKVLLCFLSADMLVYEMMLTRSMLHTDSALVFLIFLKYCKG